MLFHHNLDISPLVVSKHYEAGDVRRDPVILGRSKLDLLDTGFIAALTVERQRPLDPVLFSAFLNPLIDTAKQLLVMGCSVREAHEVILAQYEEGGNFRFRRAPLWRDGHSQWQTFLDERTRSLPRGYERGSQTFSQALTGKKSHRLRRLNLVPTEMTDFCGPTTGFLSGSDEVQRGGSKRGLGPSSSFRRRWSD